MALLLIDVINDFDFAAGRTLLRFALPASRRIAALKKRARAAGLPIVYVNDNFGRWRSDFRGQVDHCLRDDSIGREIVEMLAPDDDDFFVLKPKHSGFHSTTLDLLLRHLGVRKLILTGFAGDICVLYTANDAYMRDYEVMVPSDCIASETPVRNRFVLQQMKRQLSADIRSSRRIRLSRKMS